MFIICVGEGSGNGKESCVECKASRSHIDRDDDLPDSETTWHKTKTIPEIGVKAHGCNGISYTHNYVDK